jgi:hypothetical protein
MNSTVARRDGLRSVVVVAFLTAGMFAVMAFTAAAGHAPSVSAAPELIKTLHVSGEAANRIWDAYDSWWATALGLALIPLGFGAWAVTIRLTFETLVKTLGKKAAKGAALAF